MKKAILFAVAASIAFCCTTYGKTDKEILFRDIPWGTSCTNVESNLFVLDYDHIEGDWSTTCSTDEIIYGQMEGINFANNDINICSFASLESLESLNVAGYTPTEMDLYYAYTLNNKKLNKIPDESALYGAEYQFEPQDLYGMKDDIEGKLTSLYGEPDSDKEESNTFIDKYYTYTFWEGANNTKLVLVTEEDTTPETDILHMPNKLRIIYLWTVGDGLLQEASDAISAELGNAESNNFGSDNTDGL